MVLFRGDLGRADSAFFMALDSVLTALCAGEVATAFPALFSLLFCFLILSFSQLSSMFCCLFFFSFWILSPLLHFHHTFLSAFLDVAFAIQHESKASIRKTISVSESAKWKLYLHIKLYLYIREKLVIIKCFQCLLVNPF